MDIFTRCEKLCGEFDDHKDMKKLFEERSSDIGFMKFVEENYRDEFQSKLDEFLELP